MSFLKKETDMGIWDLRTGDLLRETQIPINVKGMEISRDGRYVAVWGQQGVRVWEHCMNSLKLLWRAPEFLEVEESGIEKSEMSELNRELFTQLQKERKNPVMFNLLSKVEDAARWVMGAKKSFFG